MKDLFNGLQRSDAEKKKIIDTNRTVIYTTATKTFCCNFNSNKIKLEQGKLMVERMKKTHMDKTIRRQCDPPRPYERTELKDDSIALYFTFYILTNVYVNSMSVFLQTMNYTSKLYHLFVKKWVQFLNKLNKIIHC